MSHITVTSQNFKEAVLEAKNPVILDFWASWCGPCRMIAPILEEIANERDDVIIAKVNVDEESKLAQQFGIMSIPTLLVFHNGELINKAVGFMEKDRILALLD